jgi:purine-binding chemotaxis protein CheW
MVGVDLRVSITKELIMRPPTMTQAPHAKPAIRTANKTDKYLAFYLGKEDYGIEVMKVREIIGVQDITAVPHTPAYVKGVINLRGKVIPVLDLRLKLGLEEAAHTPSTCIIVIEPKRLGGSSLTGVIVDGVSEVVTAIASEIEAPPDFGGNVAIDHVCGLAKMKGRVKILLDIEGVLGMTAAEESGNKGVCS